MVKTWRAGNRLCEIMPELENTCYATKYCHRQIKMEIEELDATKGQQLDVFDFGAADRFDCQKCAWIQAHGYCYPKETIGRQYFYKDNTGRHCSDYCTRFASASNKQNEMHTKKSDL